MANKDKKVYSFSSKVKHCDRVGGWHSVELPQKQADQIKKSASSSQFGFIPIEATIKDVTWKASLMPSQGTYIIPLKAKVRKDVGTKKGDVVKISFVMMQVASLLSG